MKRYDHDGDYSWNGNNYLHSENSNRKGNAMEETIRIEDVETGDHIKCPQAGLEVFSEVLDRGPSYSNPNDVYIAIKGYGRIIKSPDYEVIRLVDDDLPISPKPRKLSEDERESSLGAFREWTTSNHIVNSSRSAIVRIYNNDMLLKTLEDAEITVISESYEYNGPIKLQLHDQDLREIIPDELAPYIPFELDARYHQVSIKGDAIKVDACDGYSVEVALA